MCIVKIIWLFICLFSFCSLHAQDKESYYYWRDQGIASYRNQAFEQSINELKLARLMDDRPVNHDIESWIDSAYGGYVAVLQAERARADTALSIANRVLDQLFFYHDKFGLTLKLVSYGDPEVYRYGFIDRLGNEVIPFEFEEASPFSLVDGFARVTLNGTRYLMDTAGIRYTYAERIEDIGPETEILDIHSDLPDSLPETIGDYPQLKGIIAYGQRWSARRLRYVPESIGKLINLETLVISYHDLSKLPESIGELKRLTNLIASYGSLNTLPESFGQLTSLRKLTLYQNKLTHLPESFGNLPQLEFADFLQNKITRLADNMGNLNKLRELYLSSNPLEELPESFGNLSNLIHLEIEYTKLTSLPANFGELTALEVCKLGRNSIAELPFGIGNLHQLRILDLYRNRLRKLPPSIGQLAQVTDLRLGTNQLSTLPNEIGDLIKLEELDLGNNQLVTLPSSMGNLKAMRKLYIPQNQLINIPVEIGNLRNLERLSLGRNNLTFLPEEMGALESLTYLALGGNKLDKLPGTFTRLRNLESLYLNKNEFKEMPISLTHLWNLKNLTLSNNPIEVLPAEISEMEGLETLRIANAALTHLPETMGQLPQLEALFLSDNQLTYLPQSLGRASRLNQLALDQNPIVALPENLCLIPHIEVERDRREWLFEQCGNMWIKNWSDEKMEDEATVFLSKKEYPAAYRIYEELTLRYESESIFWHNRSWAALFMGAYEDAITAAKRSLELDPEQTNVNTNLALAYLLNGQYVEAEQIYRAWKGRYFSGETMIADDFFLQDIEALKKAGIFHPDYVKVETLLRE